MKKQLLISGGILLIALIAAVGILYGQPLLSYIKDQKKEVAATPSERQEEEPTADTLGKFKLPEGKQTYRIAQAEEAELKILEATIDPPDVHVGDTQRLEVIVQGPDPIVSVEAKIELDHEVKVLPLEFIGEVAAKDLAPNPYFVGKNGVLALRPPSSSIAAASAAGPSRLKYGASWVVYDTHDTFYHTTFVVKDAKGRTKDITLAWSDACGISMSGAWTSTSDCTISDDDGVENGNVTLDTNDDLTLNADFAWNPTYKITLDSTASIIIGTNRQLVKTYIWARDDDNDAWTHTGIGLRLQDSDPGADWYRRGTRTAIGDCDDTVNTTWQTLTLALDNDRDRLTENTAAAYCVGSTACSANTYQIGTNFSGTCGTDNPRYYVLDSYKLGTEGPNSCSTGFCQ